MNEPSKVLYAEDEDIGGERVTLPNALCWGGRGGGGAAKGLRRSPLRRMKRLEVVMQDMIRSIQADRKLKQMRVCLIKLHSNLSKAFPRSSFIVMVPFLLLEVFME